MKRTIVIFSKRFVQVHVWFDGVLTPLSTTEDQFYRFMVVLLLSSYEKS